MGGVTVEQPSEGVFCGAIVVRRPEQEVVRTLGCQTVIYEKHERSVVVLLFYVIKRRTTGSLNEQSFYPQRPVVEWVPVESLVDKPYKFLL